MGSKPMAVAGERECGGETRASGLVCLLGDQLWWDLEALAHWGEHLDVVALVGTAFEWRSGGPAERFGRFVEANLPTVRVIRRETTSTHPNAVAAVIRQITESRPERWIVSGAGGTRLMFAGALAAVSVSDQATFVYRDERMGWHEIDQAGHVWVVTGLDPRASERFSAADLLSVTWGDGDFEVRSRSANIDPTVSEAARRVAGGAAWRNAFELLVSTLHSRSGSRKLQRGFLFEEFVLAIVRELGVAADDVLVGATLADTAFKVQEVDVIVNCGGRLHLIDCKLSKPGRNQSIPSLPIGSQIREADSTQHHLGDGGMQVIMLRPNWVLDNSFRKLAQLSRVKVVDEQDLLREHLPDLLARLLGIPR